MPTTDTKERPIIFCSEMVRVIISGHKQMTRRVVRFPTWFDDDGFPEQHDGYQDCRPVEPKDILNYCTNPYGQPGDKLWIRETHQFEWPSHYYKEEEHGPFENWTTPIYKADGVDLDGWGNPETDEPLKWKPSIFMPRWASRITLEVTDVRVERLQDISETDAKAEGCEPSNSVELKDGSPCYTDTFQKLWKSIHGVDDSKSWESDPFVWIIEFRRICDAS